MLNLFYRDMIVNKDVDIQNLIEMGKPVFSEVLNKAAMPKRERRKMYAEGAREQVSLITYFDHKELKNYTWIVTVLDYSEILVNSRAFCNKVINSALCVTSDLEDLVGKDNSVFQLSKSEHLIDHMLDFQNQVTLAAHEGRITEFEKRVACMDICWRLLNKIDEHIF